MEDKEKIMKEPPLSLLVHLYIFFTFMVYDMWKFSQQIMVYKNDALEGLQSFWFQVAFYGLDVVLYLFAFIGMCRVLKLKSDAIAMLKLSAIYFLLQTISQASRNYYLWQNVINIAVIIWLIVFLYYLYKGKAVKEYFPCRSFGWNGVWGCFIYAACLTWYIMYAKPDLDRDRNSDYWEDDEIALQKGEKTTGLFSFVPEITWKQDTVITNTDGGHFYMYSDTTTNKRIDVCGMVCKIDNKTDYYKTVSQISKHMYEDIVSVDELKCSEDSLAQGVLYSNVYDVKTSNDTITWTIGIYVASQSRKICIVSYNEEHENSASLKVFCEKVNFNLVKRVAK